MKRFILTAIIILFCSLACVAKETINVAFNIDNNYATYMLLTINSILQNNTSKSEYTFYIVENDLTTKNKKRITEFVNKYNQQVEFVHINKDKLDIGKSYYINHPITNIAYARIFLPELLPNLDKVLYLDSDILVLSDLIGLYNTDISKHAMGMCFDFARNNYYNDGVILMNLKFMRAHKLVDKMVQYTLTHPDLLYSDQDVINQTMKGYIKTINQKWNNQFYYDRTKIKIDGGIIHYISSVKPWMTFPKKSCPARYLYFKYWFNSDLKFYFINAIGKNIKDKYIKCYKDSISNIKLQLGYPKNTNNYMNVAFTIDDNYWLYTLLTINSILKHNTSHSFYHFYVIENNLSDKHKARMEHYIKSRHQSIEFINVDTSAVDNGKNLYKKTKEHKYISRIAMARIFLPNLLPENEHKVLYLDSDLLVLTDLKELYDTDITKYSVAMAGDLTEVLKAIQMPETPAYYNSGVILMNLDYWRKHKITDKMVKYMNTKKYLPKMDQDLINLILKGTIKTIDAKWNNQYAITSNNYNGIIHFVGPDKPWQYRNHYYKSLKYTQEYYKYWNTIPLKIYFYHYLFSKMIKYYIYNSQHFMIELTLWTWN